jgi:hypothetical protein
MNKSKSEIPAETATVPNNEPEALAKIAALLTDANYRFEKILEESPHGEASDVLVARLAKRNSDDVVLVCDIRLVSKNGEIFRVFGENTMPHALSPGMIGNAHETFDRMLDATVVRPLLVGFQNHLTERVVPEDRAVPRISDVDMDEDKEVDAYRPLFET